MSKGNSGLFTGTIGVFHVGNFGIIALRTKGLDLREHPVKKISKLSARELKRRVDNKTATKNEYKQHMSNVRLAERRNRGVNKFWEQERERILSGKHGTRRWTQEQLQSILDGHKPKHNGKTIQGHHTYSVIKYPHLADKGEVIYPATFKEHLYGWHGGNFRKSKPGVPIVIIVDF